MPTVGKDGSIIEKLKEILEKYLRGVSPKYYPPVENLLDLIYEHYTENNPVEKNTVAGKAAKAKEKELEEWLRSLEGMDRLVDLGDCEWRTEADHRVHRERNYDGAVFSSSDVDIRKEDRKQLEEDTAL